MSRFHRSLVTCPRCSNDIDGVIWDMIDAGSDPDLKDKLFRKQIQEQECQNCGETFVLAEPLIYREDQHQLLVFYWPAERGEDAPLPYPEHFPGMRLRRVRQYNELIELVHIADHHFDDRLMAVVKVAIRSRGLLDPVPEEIHFLTADDRTMRFLVRSADGEWFTVDFPTDLYRNTESLFSDDLEPDEGWQTIDETSAVARINRLSEKGGQDHAQQG